MKEQIVVAGSIAYDIERAARTSFYGIMGNNPTAAVALRECHAAVEKHLDDTGIDWNWFMVLDATITSTSGRSPTAVITYNRE